MPFDDEEQKPSPQAQKIGLKKVSSQKSVFDSIPEKPSQEDLEQRVKQIQDRGSSYKTRAADLAVQFNRTMADKTLPLNKNIFQKEVEKELLTNMVRLAQEVNVDPNERDGEGSLSWIILLLKTCFEQRDRLNNLEYLFSQIDKKIDLKISKEISQALDVLKKSE